MSVNYNDYRAAVERLRRVASGEDDGVVYPYARYASTGTPWIDIVSRLITPDKLTVYDAEHDPTPATVEWLESIGFVWNKDDGAMYNGEFAVDPTTRTKSLPIYLKNRFVIDSPTRGDVLTALRLFGKKEGAA